MTTETYAIQNRRSGDPRTIDSPSLWRRIHDRLRLCPDTEPEQNLVRLIITSFFFFYTIAYALWNDVPIHPFSLALGIYIGYTLVIFVWIYYSPKKSVLRRILYTLGDRGMTTAGLLLFGEWITPAYVLYLWLDVGNAARYGRQYLYLSTVCSTIGFGLVLFYNEYWQSLGLLGIGLWFGIMSSPYYAGLFLRRLNEANERLNELATHDSLTQLPNRAFLYERLNEAIAAAERHKRTFVVLFVDLDDFKQVNDSRGHAAGDEALRAAARQLSESVREADTVARLGGDEFVILLLDAADNERRHIDIGNNIRDALRLYTPDRLSASIGIATYPSCGTDAETLVRHADRAMYAAKRAGKQQCHVCRHPFILSAATCKGV
ncbi:MAG: GGDEF domain-containing protein [Gammaproteobacteria bacterium]|nr:GGDEF domain-containing protein [Gammaproteobacteria bacterium]